MSPLALGELAAFQQELGIAEPYPDTGAAAREAVTASQMLRLKTLGLAAFTYGRIEARIQIPYGQGIWPAFWMLGSDIATVGWPRCGEIDIMEKPWLDDQINHAVHWDYGQPKSSAGTHVKVPGVMEGWHTYALLWTAGEYVFYDGPPFATGLPHFGHFIPSTVKDVIPRYQTMRGKKVDRRFGWDCHGLPVEYEMEQTLKISGKREIERRIAELELRENALWRFAEDPYAADSLQQVFDLEDRAVLLEAGQIAPDTIGFGRI